MQFVYVSGYGNISNENLISLFSNIGKITPKFLYSIIEGLKQKDFGIDTMAKCGYHIRKAADNFSSNCEAFIDSGGYSILRGDISYRQIPSAIETYLYYLNNEQSHFSRIFSLDIPMIGINSEYNTKSNIYCMNKDSLYRSREILDSDKDLADKFMFVWHFKIKEQYEIFEKLYTELELSRWIGGRAIGGMVGLRGSQQINFSPFIGIAFRCLYDYFMAERYDLPFRLHFLGVYLRQDRFVIAILERLFERLLGEKIRIELSYDSINYEHSSRMNKELPIAHYDGSELLLYKNIEHVPLEIIKQAYKNTDIYEFVLDEIRLRKSEKRLINSGSFSALNIKGNIDVDKFFLDIVDIYEIVSILNSQSFAASNGRMISVLKKLKQDYPLIFTENFIKSTLASFVDIYIFNSWILTDRKIESFNNHLGKITGRIAFPKVIA